MTLGEWVRSSGDEELAALLINWMLTIVITMGGDYAKLNIKTEFDELMDYLQSPMDDEVTEALQMFANGGSEYLN